MAGRKTAEKNHRSAEKDCEYGDLEKGEKMKEKGQKNPNSKFSQEQQQFATSNN
jgi:hypothetical protein